MAAIFFFFSAGPAAKIVFAAGSVPRTGAGNYQSVASGGKVVDSQIKLVAANFRCACGGCGELFLADCTCDMPRGAVEEKNFIRKRL